VDRGTWFVDDKIREKIKEESKVPIAVPLFSFLFPLFSRPLLFPRTKAQSRIPALAVGETSFLFFPPCSNASGYSDVRITMLPGILDRHAPIGGRLQTRRPVGCGRVQQGAGLWMIAGQGGIRGCFDAQQAHLHGILPDAFDQPDLPAIEGNADVLR